MPKVTLHPKTIKEKYQLAYVKFCEALLVAETFEYPKTVDEQIVCAAQVRQVLGFYFKPEWIDPTLVRPSHAPSQGIYYFLKKSNNPYACYQLKAYVEEYRKRKNDHYVIAQRSFLAKEQERMQPDAKVVAETQKVMSLVKETYERLYSAKPEMDKIAERYIASVAPTPDNKSKIIKRFTKINYCSIGYDGAFLKNTYIYLEQNSAQDECRQAFILILYYHAFLEKRNKQLAKLLKNIPQPFKGEIETILQINNVHNIMKRFRHVLTEREPKFARRAEQFFIFEGTDISVLPDEIEVKCSEELIRINKAYEKFLYELLDQELQRLDAQLTQNAPAEKGLYYACLKADNDLHWKARIQSYKPEEHTGMLSGFILFYEVEYAIISCFQLLNFGLEEKFKLINALDLTVEEKTKFVEDTLHRTNESLRKLADLKMQEKRFQKEMEAKRREERSRKAADELKHKALLLQKEAANQKRLEEQYKLKVTLEAGLTKLSPGEATYLGKIIQNPRALHHKLDAKTFCDLVRKLPLFQLDPTTDGYNLLFNNKPIDGFHREHDKLLDGNFLQKFANVFRDLQFDISLLMQSKRGLKKPKRG